MAESGNDIRANTLKISVQSHIFCAIQYLLDFSSQSRSAEKNRRPPERNADCRWQYLNLPSPAADVLVIDENSIRASIIELGLHEAGYQRVTVVNDMNSLARRIEEVNPDVIVIDIENPNRDMLESIFQISAPWRGQLPCSSTNPTRIPSLPRSMPACRPISSMA